MQIPRAVPLVRDTIRLIGEIPVETGIEPCKKLALTFFRGVWWVEFEMGDFFFFF